MKRIATTLFLLSFSQLAFAHASQSASTDEIIPLSQQGEATRLCDGRHGPPPEAFEACENKSEGDACSVEIPDRDDSIPGTCALPPDEDGELACRPNDPPPHRRKEG